jgi:hypothetical protein
MGSQVEMFSADDKWTIELYTVEAAFLMAKAGTKTFIKVLEAVVALGLMSKEEADDSAFEFLLSMYRNVDAA